MRLVIGCNQQSGQPTDWMTRDYWFSFQKGKNISPLPRYSQQLCNLPSLFHLLSFVCSQGQEYVKLFLHFPQLLRGMRMDNYCLPHPEVEAGSLMIKIQHLVVLWAGQRSQYSDWLWAGRSGDRILMGNETSPGAHPASCTMNTGSFPGVKSGRGMTLTPHPLLVPLVTKEQSYTSTLPMDRTACTEPQCLYKGALYVTQCTSLVIRRSRVQTKTPKHQHNK